MKSTAAFVGLAVVAATLGLGGATRTVSAVQIVRVTTTGCPGVAGVATGFVLDDDTVVTVAHVLRGATEVAVDGASATVVALDHRADAAVLHVRGRSGMAALAPPVPGPVTLVRRRGHRIVTQASVVQRLATISIEELADGATYVRDGLIVGVAAVPGDSGGPVVDGRGRVVGMVFATPSDDVALSYAVSSTEISTVLERASTSAVTTGACP